MKLHTAIAIVLALGLKTQAAPVDKCGTQSGCLTFTTDLQSENTCSASGSECTYRICSTLNTAQAGCAKGGGAISHSCGKPDDQCITDSGTFNYFDIELNPYNSGTQCQFVAAGGKAEFLYKDGSGCSGSSWTDGDISCAPTTELSCTGNGNIGKECVWTVAAPTTCGGGGVPPPTGATCQAPLPVEGPVGDCLDQCCPCPVGETPGPVGTCTDACCSIPPSSTGDPHVYMFSGDKASPMGQGEFILVEYDKFSIHACHTPVGERASRNAGFVIKTPVGLIKIMNGMKPSVPAGVEVTKNGDFLFPGGEVIRASGKNGHLAVIIPEEKMIGKVRGLLGSYEPDAKLATAFTNSSGSVVMRPDITKGQTAWGKDYVLHFQESWRVSPENALFTEEECPRGNAESTVIPAANPVWHGGTQVHKYVWDNCPAGMKQAAEKMCAQGMLYDECLHDVATTCDLAEWVRHSHEAHNHLNVLPHEDHVKLSNPHRHR